MQTTSQRSYGRSILSGMLVGFGALVFFLGVVALWAYDTVLDADRFAGTVLRAVEQEEVKAEIGRIVTDQSIALRSDLIAVRPLLETVVDSVIGSRPFRRILAVAARDTNRSILEGREHTILLDISDTTTLVLGGLKAFDPNLAARLPPSLEAGLIEVRNLSIPTELVGLADDIKELAFVLPVVALLAWAGAVAISPERRRAVTSIGIALGFGAVLALIAVDVGRHQAGARFDSPETARAVEVVYQTFTESLASWLWLIAAFGVVLAAAASATLSLTDTQTRWAGIRRRVTTMPSSTRGRLAYAGVGILLGLFLLVDPGAVLLNIARAAGLLLLYFGGAELLRLSGLADARPRGAVAAANGRGPHVRFDTRPLAAGAIALAVVLGGFVLWENRDAFRTDSVVEAAEIDRCNGHAELCDRTLPEVAFAATHNSISAAREPGWYFASHDGGILAQLQAGIRGFLIDTHYGFEGQSGVATDLSNPQQRAQIESQLDPAMIDAANRLSSRRSGVRSGTPREVFLCHGFCELGATRLDTALGQVYDFLKENPNEVIILFFEDYVSPEDTEAAFVRSRLIDYVYTHEPDAAWPTLEEMIQRDQRVLVLSEKVGDNPNPAWYHDGFALAQETPFAFKRAEDFNCLPNRGNSENPLFVVNHFLDRMPPAPSDSAVVNAYALLLARARQCHDERQRVPTILAINFYEIGDLLRVVDAINGVDGDNEGR
ncbi:MAG: hypothetical protein AB7U18_06125 [Dehalococcoidia bacterium]